MNLGMGVSEEVFCSCWTNVIFLAFIELSLVWGFCINEKVVTH